MDRLQLMQEPMQPLQPHAVRVEIKSIGLNFADIFAIMGLYGATPEGSFVPGLEYAGIVVETGSAVSKIKTGQRVMGVTRFGAYTTHVDIDERYVVALPEHWSYDEGAAYLVQVLTAYYALTELAGIKQGQTVLIHSAAGGVGIWANRIAKKYDAYTIGSVGSSGKLSLLQDEGYDRGIVRDKDFSRKLKAALDDRQLDIVLECIGGSILMDSYKAMGRMGRMIVYGSARYAHPGSKPNYIHLLKKYLTRPKIDPQKMIESNKSIMGFNLIYLFEKADLMHRLLGQLEEMSPGKPLIGHRFAFDQLKEAITLFQSGKTTGKVVVTV
jgi:alcohol dehydrogenase